MLVTFAEIPAEGLRLDINDVAWFPDGELHRVSPVLATALLVRQGERVFLEGSIQTTIELDCDRCLESFAYPLVSDFQVEFEVADPARPDVVVDEHVCAGNEMDMIYLDRPEIDIFQVLREQAFLARPQKTVCAEDCQGLCPFCGVNRKGKGCSCQNDDSDSPFSVLANLKQ